MPEGEVAKLQRATLVVAVIDGAFQNAARHRVDADFVDDFSNLNIETVAQPAAAFLAFELEVDHFSVFNGERAFGRLRRRDLCL